MTNSKARTAAMITPVGQEAQDEARALARDGRTGKAVRRLRRGSWLKRGPAREAVELLVAGHALPTTSGQALDALRELDPGLVDELVALLDGGQQIAAVKLVRERTGVDLAGGYHLVVELGGKPPGTR
ncbi:hypothetical protein AB0I06_26430 [Streptomyces sp. NPDC050674]|uniref:hypothetical protein n=1 Tax=Streptomyces sp. NPDC050674 TaxID=3157216 RepID=UPI0034419AAE